MNRNVIYFFLCTLISIALLTGCSSNSTVKTKSNPQTGTQSQLESQTEAQSQDEYSPDWGDLKELESLRFNDSETVPINVNDYMQKSFNNYEQLDIPLGNEKVPLTIQQLSATYEAGFSINNYYGTDLNYLYVNNGLATDYNPFDDPKYTKLNLNNGVTAYYDNSTIDKENFKIEWKTPEKTITALNSFRADDKERLSNMTDIANSLGSHKLELRFPLSDTSFPAAMLKDANLNITFYLYHNRSVMEYILHFSLNDGAKPSFYASEQNFFKLKMNAIGKVKLQNGEYALVSDQEIEESNGKQYNVVWSKDGIYYRVVGESQEIAIKIANLVK